MANMEAKTKCTLAATLMQKLFGVAEHGPGEDSQFVSLASTSVCRKSPRGSLKEELERANPFHYSKHKQKISPKGL